MQRKLPRCCDPYVFCLFPGFSPQKLWTLSEGRKWQSRRDLLSVRLRLKQNQGFYPDSISFLEFWADFRGWNHSSCPYFHIFKQFTLRLCDPLRQQQQVHYLCYVNLRVKLTEHLQTGNQKSDQNLYLDQFMSRILSKDFTDSLKIKDKTFSVTVSSRKMQLC